MKNCLAYRKRLLGAVLILLAQLAPGTAAFAQGRVTDDVSPNRSVRERIRPEFQALGIRTGAFTIFPESTSRLIYNDNILATPDEFAETDVIADLSASLRAVSNWERHRLNISGNVNRREYVDRASESTTDYGFTGEGQLNLGSQLLLLANGSYRRETESRGESQTVFGADSPVRFNDFRSEVAIQATQTRFRETFGLRFANVDFEDVTFDDGEVNGDQDFRDRQAYGGFARFDYRFRPLIGIFARGAYNVIEYDQIQPFAFAEQDSRNLQVLGGVFFDVARVARAEIGVGYSDQDYRSEAFADVSGLNIDANIEYFLSGLTTVTLRLSRDIQEAFVFGGGGLYENSITLQVDHELLPSVIVGLEAGYSRNEFQNIDRNEDIQRYRATVDYFFRRSVGVRLAFGRRSLSSNQQIGRADFDQNVATLSLVLRM
ncbi:MAG: outer membrane beta-barrel protein [Pseudomonadota bacterium]